MKHREYPARLAGAFLPAIDAVATEAFGGQLLPEHELAKRVRELSEIYTRGRALTGAVTHDDALRQARLRFYLGRDLPKIQGPLGELAAVGALPVRDTLRILDVGAGLGASGLGAAELLLRDGSVARVEIDAVDQDAAALALYERLARRLKQDVGLAVHVRAHAAAVDALAQLPLASHYDLIVVGYLINELVLQQPAHDAFAFLSRLCQRLQQGGALVVLEPALHAQARALQSVRDAFAAHQGSPHVFAPCLHSHACPMLHGERDWCHERVPMQLPAPLSRLARAAGLRQDHISFSYLTLHQERRSLSTLGSEGVEGVPLRAVSAPRKSKGKLELHLCGGSGLSTLRRLDRHQSPANEGFARAGRGDIIAVPAPPTEAALRVAPETPVQRLHGILEGIDAARREGL